MYGKKTLHKKKVKTIDICKSSRVVNCATCAVTVAALDYMLSHFLSFKDKTGAPITVLKVFLRMDTTSFKRVHGWMSEEC